MVVVPALDTLALALGVSVEELVPDLEEEARVHRVAHHTRGVVRVVVVAVQYMYRVSIE